MKAKHVGFLRCPSCEALLELCDIQESSGEDVVAARLVCRGCDQSYPVIRSIPRFVHQEGYADNFGLQWTLHAHTQYDSHSGVDLSKRRFFEETGWSSDMRGQTILEAGSGSGRFSVHVAETGAMVVSFDLSNAVDVNYAANGSRDNVLIVQGDMFRIPCPPSTFDKVLCLGVLQHTPDPHRAFKALVRQVKPGGELVIDIYEKTFARYVLGTKYWVRPFTRGVDPETLYGRVCRYIDIMWPIASVVRRIPRIGPALNWRLMVADHSGLGVPPEHLKEWARLDTFDMLSPRYDCPQTIKTVRTWFAEAGFGNVDVRQGYNGIQAKGTRPA